MTQTIDPTDKPPPPAEDSMTLLTVAEACDMLKLAERTVRLWMAEGKLPYVRLGDSKGAPVRLRKRDVIALQRPGAPAA